MVQVSKGESTGMNKVVLISENNKKRQIHLVLSIYTFLLCGYILLWPYSNEFFSLL